MILNQHIPKNEERRLNLSCNNAIIQSNSNKLYIYSSICLFTITQNANIQCIKNEYFTNFELY